MNSLSSSLGSRVQFEPVPQAILDSPLMKNGGFDVFEGLANAGLCKRLLGEARQRLTFAHRSETPFSDNDQIRGGRPARCFLSAPGGDVQATFYHAPGVIRFLEAICNAVVVPTGPLGTYTYYVRPGDHLALHRDIKNCDVAVITCLLDRHTIGASGGMTCLYPQRRNERLSSIRASPDRGALTVRVSPGQTMVMFGGLVSHAILPLGVGDSRIVSVLCYRASQAYR